jgi:hypothetical protein
LLCGAVEHRFHLGILEQALVHTRGDRDAMLFKRGRSGLNDLHGLGGKHGHGTPPQNQVLEIPVLVMPVLCKGRSEVFACN